MNTALMKAVFGSKWAWIFLGGSVVLALLRKSEGIVKLYYKKPVKK
jgi:hypothetical protein